MASFSRTLALLSSAALLASACGLLEDGSSPSEAARGGAGGSGGSGASGGSLGFGGVPPIDLGYHDTDDDGLEDSKELALGFDPHDPDTDDDGCGDLAESHFHDCRGDDLTAMSVGCGDRSLYFVVPETLLRPTGTLRLVLWPEDPASPTWVKAARAARAQS